MKHKSSYRKLKDKLRELEHDIKVMVLHSETEEAIDIYLKYKAKFEDDR